MQTIAQAFEAFLQKLELTSGQRQDASRQHTNLRQELQKRMDVEDNFLSGSYARRTAVRPLNDIDVFLVLKPSDSLSLSTKPSVVLSEVKGTLEDIYPGKSARPQSRSVNIEFSGTGIAYDVVPAFKEREGVYSIPDRDQDAWIQTDPKVHSQRSTEANESANKKLKPLFKAVKQSNNNHGKPARSFHLEVLSWAAVQSDPGLYIDGLVQLVDGLRQRIYNPCPDPAGLGPDVRPPAARLAASAEWLDEIAALARDAQSLSKDGRTGEAHAKMREIFGDEWPEKGTSGKRGSAIIVGGAVDHEPSRFG